MKSIESQQTEIHTLGEAVSPMAAGSVTIPAKKDRPHNTNTCRAKLESDSDKASVGNNFTFSSIQATLATDAESAAKCNKAEKGLDC